LDRAREPGIRFGGRPESDVAAGEHCLDVRKAGFFEAALQLGHLCIHWRDTPKKRNITRHDSSLARSLKRSIRFCGRGASLTHLLTRMVVMSDPRRSR